MVGMDVPMSLRLLIVEVDTKSLNVTRFCAEHGISTWFFYDLRRRYAAGGLAALEAQSRAPHRVANRTPDLVEDAIVALRKELTDAGLDAGPATIGYHLEQRRGRPVPSGATIWRILHRRGFVTPDPSKRPRPPVRRFSAERANECWQNDDTAWELVDLTIVKIINTLDDCSRVLVASRAVPTCTAEAVFDTLTGAAQDWGWPERMLWDNAKAHHALTDTLAALGIGTRHPRPYHPQTCGKIERFHRTLKQWLAARDRASSIAELQAQLDEFRSYYNTQRPHRSIGRKVPTQVWHATPKSGPAGHALDTPTKIRHITVATNGTVSIGQRYMIIIGRAHAGSAATLVTTGLTCHIFIHGRLTRTLTLDPTRRVQPINPKP